MSLVKDYLDKTSAPVPLGQGVSVPPMLHSQKDGSFFRLRLVSTIGVICAVLGVSGYAFITSLPKSAHRMPAKKEVVGLNMTDAPVQPHLPPADPVLPADLVSSVDPVSSAGPVSSVDPLPVQVPPPALARESETPAALAVTLRVPMNQVAAKTEKQVLSETVSAVKDEPPDPDPTENDIKKQVMPVSTGPVAGKGRPEGIRSKSSQATPQTYFTLGVAAHKAGDFAAALGFYQKTLALDPDHASALLNLAAIHMETGNLGPAARILETLYDQSPGNTDVVLNLGILYIRQKNYTRAHTLFEGYKGAHPGILFNLAYLNQVQHRDQNALDLYDRVLALDPAHTKACLAAASICEQGRRIPLALAYYGRARGYASGKLKQKIENRIKLLRRIKADQPGETGETI